MADRPFHSPSNLEHFDQGEEIFIEINGDEDIAERQIYVTLTANGIAYRGNSSEGEIIPHGTLIAEWLDKADEDDYDCRQNLLLQATFKDCDLRGNFILNAKFKERTNEYFCQTEWNETDRTIINISIGELGYNITDANVHFPCPGEEYTLDFETKDGYNGNAYWYRGDLDDFEPNLESFLVTHKPEYLNGTTYQALWPRYKSVYGSNQLSYVFAHQTKIQHGCRVEDYFPSQADILIGTGLGIVTPPEPQFLTFCEGGEHTISVDQHYLDLFGNLDVAWYRPGENMPFHFGQSLTKTFSEVSELIYVTYYRDGDCERESVKIPIHVFVIPNVNLDNVDFPVKIENHRIFDHRDVNQECYDQPSFYHDLMDGTTIGGLLNDLNSELDFIASEINNASPFIDFQISNVGDLKWLDEQGLESYTQVGEELRVCSENITQNQGEYSSKNYYLSTTINFRFRTYDANGNLVKDEQRNCDLRNVRRKRIQNVKAGSSSPSNGCIPPQQEVVDLILPSGTIDGLPCESSEIVRICPASGNVVIGPSPGVDPPLVNSYSWTPSDGLSDSNVKNPTINYEDLPIEDYQLIRYDLIYGIESVNDLSRHCTVVYKCRTCEPSDIVKETLQGL